MSTDGPLRLHAEPDLREPTLVLAYAGWNDGGESATTALRYVVEQLAARQLARIDTDEFLDFTVARPHVRLTDDGKREIVWPEHEFLCVRDHADVGDFVFGVGIEPHTRWRVYTRTLLELVRAIEARRVILLGAYLADVIYSQPIRVTGFSSDPELQRELGLGSSGYQGPTGMVGVLGEALRADGVATLSMWASLPHYVSVTPNTRGALALLDALERATGLRVDHSQLEVQAGEFDAQVSELIAGDPQLTAYVRELKRRAFSS